jgi:hypothetical protein
MGDTTRRHNGQHDDGNGGTTMAMGQLQKLLLPHPGQVDLQVFYFDLLEIFMEVPVLAFDT